MIKEQIDKSSIERFEMLAAAFYQKHGILAPGKDIAPGSGDMTTDERRWELWREFLKDRN